MSESIQIRLHKTILRPAVTYEAETWTLTGTIEKKTSSFKHAA